MRTLLHHGGQGHRVQEMRRRNKTGNNCLTCRTAQAVWSLASPSRKRLRADRRGKREYAHQAMPREQIAIAKKVVAANGGTYRAWPGCRAYLGLP